MNPKYERSKLKDGEIIIGIDLKGPEGFSVAVVNAGDEDETLRISKLIVSALNSKRKSE